MAGSRTGDSSTEGSSVAGLIARCTRALERSAVCFGHGTDNARDEAAALVFHVLDLDHDDALRAYGLTVSAAGQQRVAAMLEARITTRRPLPYLTGEAWFAGLRFAVDERVLVPRSPFAELIMGRFEPWLDPAGVRRILEIGTGSGCMAIACARAFPDSSVVATDISAAALEVARRNVARYELADRVQLVEADLYAGVTGTFDLIISNPPYVSAEEVASLPDEYRHEPALALLSDEDGMATPARILQHATRFLSADGWLALEVGGGAALLEARFANLPFIWPEFEHGGDGIALISAVDLRASECPATP
ncbi:MAG: 50S ribosomal protein L3 N(5)-glutamine methyltransferase [Gammaproteobacteria bacterium]|nr:50S ribosomal protein L3 N(5)-glutamine methyltransferase [Gammaproteobacteria bacterium]